MSRLYEYLVHALPHQWCQVQGNTNCSWTENTQMLQQKWSVVLEWRLMERTSTLFIPVSFPFIAAIFPSSQSPFGGRSSNQQLQGSTSSSSQIFLLAWSYHLLPSPWAWQPSGDHSSSAVPVWYTTIRLTWPVAWPLPICLSLWRNTGVLFHHFPWVSQKHFTSKAVDTSTEMLGVWGNVRVEFWFTATVALKKLLCFWNKGRKQKRKITGSDDVSPYDLCDEFSVKARETHSDCTEKYMLEPTIFMLSLRKHSLASQISCICEWSIETGNWEQFLSPASILRQHCSVV